VYALATNFACRERVVLQFDSFDGHSDNPFPPSQYVTKAVVYTGTQTTLTTRGCGVMNCRITNEGSCGIPEAARGESGEAAPALMDLVGRHWPAVSNGSIARFAETGGERGRNERSGAELKENWQVGAARKDMMSDRAFEWLRI